MRTDEIHPEYGVPKEDISCPGCGRLYTTARGCLACDECIRCCACLPKKRHIVSGKIMVAAALYGFPRQEACPKGCPIEPLKDSITEGGRQVCGTCGEID